MSRAQVVKARNVQARIAAQRAADRRVQARRKILITTGSAAAVVAIVVALVVIKLTASPPKAGPAGSDAAVASQVTSVPAGTFNSVGAGTATGLKAISGEPVLRSGGKPEVLYMGGEFCPYCAAERWALAAAVSRFGTLSGVTFIHSSPTDTYPDTPTLSFAKASYASRYLNFTPVEWYGEAPDPSTPFGHVYLQQPTRAEAALFGRYSGGSIPFVDIGNRFVVPQAQYLPPALAGLSWAQVAAAMHDPSSPVGKDIDGAANILTRAICTLTHGKPGAVCTSPGVRAA
jgi:hypothetical protein